MDTISVINSYPAGLGLISCNRCSRLLYVGGVSAAVLEMEIGLCGANLEGINLEWAERGSLLIEAVGFYVAINCTAN
ncbi:hypothetical protein CEXT_495921 [Caerostris extrusa]|uniref:Uncharacterized protein n=1 Tax=Caerostris extrusa TaxID=172846 RepID=A0AAV4MR67_CAEEX|nr:hypothetical protein CEXT_495921 [Caerostris extrusa]